MRALLKDVPSLGAYYSEAGERDPENKKFVSVPLDLSVPIDPPVELVPGLYAGLGTTLQAEPGVGKSWIALWWSLSVVKRKLPVLYFDEEGGEALVHRRLRDLGADPELINKYFHYFPFESRTWDDQDCYALGELCDETKPALAVFDSLGDFLSAAGMAENSSDDVQRFITKVRKVLRMRDIATLTLDHLVKPNQDSKPGRYARGSGAKLAKDDLTVRIQAANYFDAQNDGELLMWKTKDRHGACQLPYLGSNPLRLDIRNTERGVTITQQQQTDEDWIKSAREHILVSLGHVGRMSKKSFISSGNKLIPLHCYDAALDELVQEMRIRKGTADMYIKVSEDRFSDND